MNELVPKLGARTLRSVTGSVVVPVLIADAGEHAARRFIEFLAATIRNKNTRMAYYRAACHFFAWVERHRIGELADIEPVHVAAYIEVLQTTAAKPTVKLHLAAIRMLFDWLVVGQVLAVNPAHAVRGPKHVVRRRHPAAVGPACRAAPLPPMPCAFSSALSPTTYGPPRLQAVITRVSDQSAPTYPVSRTKPRPRWRSARPGSHNLVGVKRHVGHQISKLPFYCQAISLPPSANIATARAGLGAPGRFFRLQGYSNSLSRFEAVPSARHRPGDPCQLVRKRHDNSVYMRPRS